MTALWRRYRGAVLVGGGLIAVLALLAVVAGSKPVGALDPDAYDPTGSHALAVLLQQREVAVTRTTDVPATLQAVGAGTTLFLPRPELLSAEELKALADAPGDVVVAGATDRELTALDLPAREGGSPELTPRAPDCDVPTATNAGSALTGGVAYDSSEGTSCYGGSLVVDPEHRATLLGSAEPLTNAHLGQDGNAALAIGLLSAQPRVVWLVPSDTRAAFGHRPLRSVDDVLPGWVHDVRWQLLWAAVLLAAWRGRRLGRVVVEPLPVVVRASETVEGHGRLYQAARARGAAAEALREGARSRLVRVAHGQGATQPELLVELVAARSGWERPAVQRLLYGPAPADDEALVRLARDLDSLTHQALTRDGAGS